MDEGGPTRERSLWQAAGGDHAIDESTHINADDQIVEFAHRATGGVVVANGAGRPCVAGEEIRGGNARIVGVFVNTGSPGLS